MNVDNEGITGLEKQYNEVLTGVNGSLMRERARDGSFIAGGAYEKVPAQDGMDIVLGIDANVQRVAEDAIAEAVERVGATYGSIIVTDPTTGEIIAACSYPTYDPPDLASASNASMNLRVVTDVYEPGSVFKTFVSAAAIEHKGLTPNTTFDVPAEVLVGSDIVRDVDKRGAAMTMSLREILRRSSNTGMVLVGEKLGADAFSEYVIDGFHRQVHGHRFPGESLGIKKRSNTTASLGSMSFGQSLAVEPVQMVRAMSAIANKGVMTTPHFLKTRAGEEVDWTDGEHRVLSEETAASVADMMLTVVDEGTGMDAQMPGYEVSGKTGTAERAGKDGGYEEGNNMASFMGFVSTKDPRVLCYVTLDGTAAMSYAATPVFRKVMEEALPALGIKPTR
ncbi:MAG: peptidoglycan D,D-transpeptidase FtsI family protein [Collinsella intestinalis]